MKERREVKSGLRASLDRFQAMARELNGDLDAIAAMLDAELLEPVAVDDAAVAHAVNTLIPQIESAVRSLIAAFSVAFGIDPEDEGPDQDLSGVHL